MLVGTENLVNRVINKEKGQQMASSLGVLFREVNPKTDDVKYVNEVLIKYTSF